MYLQVPLIPQDKTNACWLASAAMMKSWKDGKIYSLPETAAKLNSGAFLFSKIYQENQGLPFSYNVQLFQSLGIRQLPPASYQLSYIISILKRSPIAAIIMNRSSLAISHFVVIVGYSGGDSVDTTKFKINDPWPVGKGKTYEITFRDFVTKFENVVAYQNGFPNTDLTSQFYHY